jgi:hypothetical protein
VGPLPTDEKEPSLPKVLQRESRSKTKKLLASVTFLKRSLEAMPVTVFGNSIEYISRADVRQPFVAAMYRAATSGIRVLSMKVRIVST